MRRCVEPELFKRSIYAADHIVNFGDNPLFISCKRRFIQPIQRFIIFRRPALHLAETADVPQLVGKVAPEFTPLVAVTDVHTHRRNVDDGET